MRNGDEGEQHWSDLLECSFKVLDRKDRLEKCLRGQLDLETALGKNLNSNCYWISLNQYWQV